MDLRTKYIAENEIKQIYPNVTIIRPTTVYGRHDTFIRTMIDEREYFHHYNLVFDDCTARR